MANRDRDKSVEQWLRQTPVAGAPVEDCLDAETLAAWTEGLLDGPQRAMAEAHAASCARCQAMLAVMVRTTPAPAAGVRSPFRKWFMMLGPAMAAAAAVALWVAVDQNPRPTSPVGSLSSTQAKAEGGPAATSVRSEVAPPPVAADKESDRKDSVDALDRSAPTVPVDARRQIEKRAGARESERAGAAPVPGNERDEKKDFAAAAPPPPALPAAAAESSVQAAAKGRVVPGAPSGPAPLQQFTQLPNQNQAQNQTQGQAQNQAPRPVAEPRAERVIAPAEQPVAGAAGDSGRAAPRSSVTGGLADSATEGFRGKAASFDVAVPDSGVRWRVVEGRTIQHSLDAGATWAPQHTVETDVVLTAGAAPSSSVCWLVGRAGAMVLTTDGRAWRRLTFSVRADLTSVTSTDARTATVTTADGRLFGTTDGGRTWTRR